MEIQLRDVFIKLVSTYTSDQRKIEMLWSEIEFHYQEKHRYYHTLEHLSSLYDQLIPIKEDIVDWSSLLFTLFYHDIVYSPTSKSNEEDSARFAIKHLQEIGCQQQLINTCEEQILATKSHQKQDNKDTQLFLDADLSILGFKRDNYITYSKQVRKEYRVFPNVLYKKGRKKVIKHFLEMKSIYHTSHFNSLYEEQARDNLSWELTQYD